MTQHSNHFGSNEQIQFVVLRRLHEAPEVTQRALAQELGISLGSINYCLRALIGKGFVKIHNFRRSNHKLRYAYLLTPAGVVEKSKLTAEFLRCKVAEYEALQREIEQLKLEFTLSDADSKNHPLLE